MSSFVLEKPKSEAPLESSFVFEPASEGVMPMLFAGGDQRLAGAGEAELLLKMLLQAQLAGIGK